MKKTTIFVRVSTLIWIEEGAFIDVRKNIVMNYYADLKPIDKIEHII